MEQKRLKNTRINTENVRKMLQLIGMALQGFWANLYSFCPSNVHGRIRGNHLCSELTQFSQKRSGENQLFPELSQLYSEFIIESIRGNGIASQVLDPTPTLGEGGKNV